MTKEELQRLRDLSKAAEGSGMQSKGARCRSHADRRQSCTRR